MAVADSLTSMEAEDRITLEIYEAGDDLAGPDASFKREVGEYTRADPMETLRGLSRATGIPVGALARYALVKWAAEGSEALLALGPRAVERLWDVVAEAEAAGTDEARLDAFHVLRQMISWLHEPLR